MTIQQLSVFIENKSGTLLKVLQLLKEANIQLVASTIADTVEYCHSLAGLVISDKSHLGSVCYKIFSNSGTHIFSKRIAIQRFAFFIKSSEKIGGFYCKIV